MFQYSIEKLKKNKTVKSFFSLSNIAMFQYSIEKLKKKNIKLIIYLRSNLYLTIEKLFFNVIVSI